MFFIVQHKHSLDTFWFLLQACQFLLAAIKSGDVNTVKILIRSVKDNCTTDDKAHYTPLMFAAANGRVDLLRVLLESGANLESTNTNHYSALHAAAFNGHLDVCRLLLDSGAKVNRVTKRKRSTPLHSAAMKGHLSVVKLLVEKGANIRLKNRNGQTASDVARVNRHRNVADWLKKQFSG
jgi:ankyrin repeat protein